MSICANCCNIPCHEAKVIDDGDQSHEKLIQLHLNAQQSLKTLVKFFWVEYGKVYILKVVLQSMEHSDE